MVERHGAVGRKTIFTVSSGQTPSSGKENSLKPTRWGATRKVYPQRPCPKKWMARARIEGPGVQTPAGLKAVLIYSVTPTACLFRRAGTRPGSIAG